MRDAGIATDIAVTGTWSPVYSAGDLVSGAGSDFASQLESAGGQATMDISNSGGAGWTVRVRKSDLAWSSGASLAVKLSSPSGTGPGSVSGGASYLAVTDSDQVLMTGSGDRSGIQLRFRLQGVSIRNARGNYGTSLTYSVQ